jgi:hypothetical protein
MEMSSEGAAPDVLLCCTDLAAAATSIFFGRLGMGVSLPVTKKTAT